MAKYRGGIIGLGWTGLLYDLAERHYGPEGLSDRYGETGERLYEVDDIDRPTPDLDVHRRFYHHDHPGWESLANSFAEAMWDRPDVDLVAGAEQDEKRLKVFGERYGIAGLYTDAVEMLRVERLDIVGIATNVTGRADLTCTAVEHGAKGIFTQKPMAHTLEEADRMVKACADASVPLNAGMASIHPSFSRAKELVKSGAIGDVLSIEAGLPDSQRQMWSYFLDSAPSWVIGFGDQERRETGSDEFRGQGMMATVEGQVVHFRVGAPLLRISGTSGEIVFRTHPNEWVLWQDIDTPTPPYPPYLRGRVQMPWPDPQIVRGSGAAYSLADVIDCLEGRADGPRNSGRSMARALEVEVALKQSSAQGGVRVAIPLEDRSLGLNYDWYR